MRKSVQVMRSTPEVMPDTHSFRMKIWIEQPSNMTSKVFVMQRKNNFAKESIEDTFAAVATPTQLEDFAEDAPNEGSSYFRTDTIELVATTAELLEVVFFSILYEIKKLTEDLSTLVNLSQQTAYLVASDVPVAQI